MKQKITAILITLCMVLAIMPITALGANETVLDISQGNIEITNDGVNIGGVATYASNANGYIITQTNSETPTSNEISVMATSVDITIEDLNIAAGNGRTAFALSKNSTVTLTLSGTNTLTSGGGYAGLWVPAGASVTIQSATGYSTDSLTAKGGKYGAGIGGSDYERVNSEGADCGEITINSGTVKAIGLTGGAGIGGGFGGNGGIAEISAVSDNSTIVTATGANGGAGIGGGAGYRQDENFFIGGGSGKTIINGGTVTATGYGTGAGIGAGSDGTGGDGVDVTIDGGIVTANGANGESPGIGGDNVDVTISGGSVAATGYNEGAGIGADNVSPCGNIIITGGTVVATARGNTAAIGTRRTSNEDIGDITITGGSVIANGSANHYGIAVAGERSINISNATIIAKGGLGATRQQPTFNYMDGYKWRTSDTGSFTYSDKQVYTSSDDNKYLEVAPGIAIMAFLLDKSVLALNVNDTATLTAKFTPDNATNKTITWSSSDTNVATVDENGVVTGIAAGVATITATTANGYTATCDVTVTEIISEESGGILGFLRMVKMILELIIYIMGVFA